MTKPRQTPLDMDGATFRQLGHELVDAIASFLDSLPSRPVTPGETQAQVQALVGRGDLPEKGLPAGDLLHEAADLLFQHSLFNGHPRFMGYITSSAAPIGALGDLLAAAVNPNVGGWALSPVASEIEAQAVDWMGRLIGFPAGGGLLVSGGNMANFVAFLAARRARLPWDVRAQGMAAQPLKPLVYASRETHTWIQKAADLFGLGTDAIRWVDTDEQTRMRTDLLEQALSEDRQAGHLPFMVVATAGSVSTGAVDPLSAIASICRRHNLWFHVDGAYGALAAAVPQAAAPFAGMEDADSVALDPHKWLYAPLEAGCTLVRRPQDLLDAFSYRPSYYNFDSADEEPPTNYYELGPQNSRGFRALKVWLGLQQAGRQGLVDMIREDMDLAGYLHSLTEAHGELEAHSQHLSITTFRYVPPGLPEETPDREGYLNRLNEELLNRLQAGGEAFISNAVIGERYLLRACVVNFRTTRHDMEALVRIVVRLGRVVDAELRQD